VVALTCMEPSEALSLACDALALAYEALQAAAADLLIACVLAPSAALSNETRVLAQAVEMEVLAVGATISRYS
jgi:hypothetical protein